MGLLLPGVRLSACLSVRLSSRPSVCLSSCLSVCLSLCVCLSRSDRPAKSVVIWNRVWLFKRKSNRNQLGNTVRRTSSASLSIILLQKLFTSLHFTVLNCHVLYCDILFMYSTALDYPALYRTVLYYPILYNSKIVPHRTWARNIRFLKIFSRR